MDSLLNGLNAAQKEAVRSPAAVLQVLAPPGSGKTKTLTSRVAYLIQHDRLDPSSIIVCTFTVKAAREMRERIEGYLGKEISSKLKLGTFHSIARRFLSSYGDKINIKKRFGIADSSDSKAIVSRIIQRLKLSISPGVARNRISKLKADGVLATGYLAQSRAEGKPEQLDEELARVYVDYEDELESSNLLDYDDLLLRCAELLRRCPECVSRIEAVLVDEFQDTNHTQYDLLNLFAQHRKTISVVGDPDQSIYGWRSARMENLNKMRIQYPETVVINLEENYRSSSCILLAAQELIEQDSSRHQKSLAPTHSAGEPPALRRLATALEEAEWTVSEMKRVHALSGGLLRWEDFAVLLRSAALSRLIEKELGQAGIPYKMVGGHRFYDRVEIKLVLDYLRVISNGSHTEALARVLNVPSRRIGDRTVEKLLEEAHARKQSLWTVVLMIARGQLSLPSHVPAQAERGLELFVNIVLRGKAKLENSGRLHLADLIVWLIDTLELKLYLDKKYPKDDADARWSNVQELIAQAGEGCSSDELQDSEVELDIFLPEPDAAKSPTGAEELELFLANITLSTDGKPSDGEDEADSQGCVTLSTMHAAKGLEWPVVFIPAAYNGSIPHSRAEDADEERRLLYVAMTRAQCLLYMSCPTKDSRNGITELSPFLTPKDVRQRCGARGPSITSDLVREMARILSRESRPINLIQARTSLSSIEDDQFPQRRERTANEDDIGSDDEVAVVDAARHPRLKRNFDEKTSMSRGVKRQYNGRSSTMYATTTTTQQANSFPTTTASYSSTFVMASTLPQADKENQKPMPAKVKRPGAGKDITQQQKGSGQQGIAQFMARPASSKSTSVPASAGVEKEPSRLAQPAEQPRHVLAPTSDTTRRQTAYKPLTINRATTELQSRALGVRRSVQSSWANRMSRESG